VYGRSRTSWWGVCLDARDPDALAEFYSFVLGWPVTQVDENGAAIGTPGTTSKNPCEYFWILKAIPFVSTRTHPPRFSRRREKLSID
jgi:hypothetical protein